MGVVRDVTVEQLTQAIGGIDTSGLAKDITLQATNTALGNINTTLGGITTNDPPTDTTQQSIASAISGLGTALGSDRALIDGSNIANPSAFRQNIGAVSAYQYFDTVTGAIEIALPNNWKEVIIQLTYSGSIITTHFLYGMFTNTTVNVSLGAFGTSWAIAYMNRNSFKLNQVNWGGSNVTASTTVYIYYR